MKKKAQAVDSLIIELEQHPYFYHLALLRIAQVGPLTFDKCIQHFETPKDVFKASHQELLNLGLKQSVVDQCKAFYWLNKENHFLISNQDENYPTLLKEIHNHPPLLFVIGNVALLSKHQIAIVGSRRPSKSGEIDAYNFSKALVENGLVITSGLASGIDSCAHEGALNTSNESTIAVLAHGLDAIYPQRNKTLAAKIVNNQGAIVSEFPVGVVPKPEFFPRRNRIISGLSLGVLVVEAAVKSGSLITAYCALEQNREVFAIPGSIHNPVAKGCHKLIKNGAKLVENCSDILEEFSNVALVVCNGQTEKNELIGNQKLNENEQKVYQHLNHEEYDANELALVIGLSIIEISESLMLLELKGLIVRGETGYFKKALMELRT
jgi:DNA processing protein